MTTGRDDSAAASTLAGTTARSRPAPTPRQRHLGLASVLCGMVMFSLSPVLVADAELEGLTVAFWRAWIACAGFAVVAAFKDELSLRAVRAAALPGVCFGLSIGLAFEAAQRTSVANVALITVLIPVPMLVAARFLFGERVGAPDAGWLAVALLGAAFMVLVADNGGTADGVGDLLAVAATLLGASYLVSGRRARESVDTIPFMVGMMFWGGVVLSPIVLASGQEVLAESTNEWVRIVALAVVPGLGHMLINYAHGNTPLVTMGLTQLLMPVSATLMAWLFLDQSITAAQGLGIAVVLGALAVHTVYRSRLAARTASRGA